MKNNFFVFSLKKNLIPCIFYLFTICLVLFSNSNLIATKNGITLWANSVLPALLPFFIATELLNMDLMSYLVMQNADKEAKDKNGQTPETIYYYSEK